MCQPCTGAEQGDCDAGLTCEKGKCRGCPETSGNQIRICNPIQACEFEDIIGNVIDFIFKIVIVLAPLMVIVGGFLFLTAGGNPQKISQGRNLLIWTAVGFLVVLLSKAILAIINLILGVKGG